MKTDYRIVATYHLDLRFILYSPQIRSWKTLWIWIPLSSSQGTKEFAQEYIDLYKGTLKIPSKEIVYQETVIK